MSMTKFTKDNKVSPAYIDWLLQRVVYTVSHPGGTTVTVVTGHINGYAVASGESGCVDPANFDVKIGIEIAQRNAVAAVTSRLWQLVSWELANKLGIIPENYGVDFSSYFDETKGKHTQPGVSPERAGGSPERAGVDIGAGKPLEDDVDISGGRTVEELHADWEEATGKQSSATTATLAPELMDLVELPKFIRKLQSDTAAIVILTGLNNPIPTSITIANRPVYRSNGAYWVKSFHPKANAEVYFQVPQEVIDEINAQIKLATNKSRR